MGKFRQIFTELSARDMPIFSFSDDNEYITKGLLTKLAICIDIIKVWFGIVICPLILSRSGLGLLSCPSIIFFPDIFATIILIHKQIIATCMAGYYVAVLLFHLLIIYLQQFLWTKIWFRIVILSLHHFLSRHFCNDNFNTQTNNCYMYGGVLCCGAFFSPS